jgi:CspA family cold shock protein
MKGTVKWFNRKKAYGFLEGEDGKEYFVHSSALAQGTFIRDNDLVSFDPAESDRGLQAQNVTLLEKGSERSDLPAAEEEEPAEEEAPAEEAPAEEAPAEEPAEEAPAEEPEAEEKEE